jgi:hypothetical protein
VTFFYKIILKIFMFSLIGFNLTACMETASDLNTIRQRSEVKQHQDLQVQIQVPQIPVALISLEGAPDSTTAQLNLALISEAKLRNITLISDKTQPRFKLKGYISAYAVQGGTSLSWVWDMYDSQSQRAQRIDGSQIVKRVDSNAWAAIDDASLKLAASITMNDVANYLSNAQQETASKETIPQDRKPDKKQTKKTPQLPDAKVMPAQSVSEPIIATGGVAPKFSTLDLRR